MYSAIVLDSKSREKLKNYFTSNPDGWEFIGHHSTIKMGALPAELKSMIGKTVTLKAVAYGSNDKAIAVKVSGNSWTMNKIPHITLYVNRKGGGKPVDSNSITEWYPIPTMTLTGKIQEL